MDGPSRPAAWLAPLFATVGLIGAAALYPTPSNVSIGPLLWLCAWASWLFADVGGTPRAVLYGIVLGGMLWQLPDGDWRFWIDLLPLLPMHAAFWVQQQQLAPPSSSG